MTAYLLDTGVFLLSIANPRALNRETVPILQDGENALFLSAASSWEIGIKSKLGKLRLPEPASKYVPKRLASTGIQSLPISQVHALRAGELPAHHRDPFDRMLVAQAQSENLVLMTTDRQLSKYAVRIVMCSG